MSAHTPGPWINDSGLVYGRDSRPAYAGSPSIDIFDGLDWPAELQAEALANARLIAAAPGLLATLKAARSALKSYEYHNSSPDLAEEIGRACDAVIADATGMQPAGGELADLPPAPHLSWSGAARAGVRATIADRNGESAP